MQESTFPTLLTQKATIFGGLTRYDLLILGASYLMLSWMRVSGVFALGINLILLITLKFAERRFKRGFFRFLLSKRRLPWRYKLGGVR